MKSYSILGIKYEGNILHPLPNGKHTQEIDIIPDIQNKKKNEVHFIVCVNLNYQVNGELIFTFIVTTTFLCLGIDENNLDKTMKWFHILSVKAVDHLRGILASKYQDANAYVHVPDEPNYESLFKEIDNKLSIAFGK